MSITICPICGRPKALSYSWRHGDATCAKERVSGRRTDGTIFDSEAKCYRLGYEREKARADKAESAERAADGRYRSVLRGLGRMGAVSAAILVLATVWIWTSGHVDVQPTAPTPAALDAIERDATRCSECIAFCGWAAREACNESTLCQIQFEHTCKSQCRSCRRAHIGQLAVARLCRVWPGTVCEESDLP